MNEKHISNARDPVAHAARLAAAASDPADPDLRAKVEAELNAALADVEAGSIDLDELVAALASIAGNAIDEAARHRAAAAGGAADAEVQDREREAILRESVAGLIEAARPTPPEEQIAEPVGPAGQERRSGADRRIGDRRRHPDDSPAARVNRWLYGERRRGIDNRSGVERRAAPPDRSNGDGG